MEQVNESLQYDPITSASSSVSAAAARIHAMHDIRAQAVAEGWASELHDSTRYRALYDGCPAIVQQMFDAHEQLGLQAGQGWISSTHVYGSTGDEYRVNHPADTAHIPEWDRGAIAQMADVEMYAELGRRAIDNQMRIAIMACAIQGGAVDDYAIRAIQEADRIEQELQTNGLHPPEEQKSPDMTTGSTSVYRPLVRAAEAAYRNTALERAFQAASLHDSGSAADLRNTSAPTQTME